MYPDDSAAWMIGGLIGADAFSVPNVPTFCTVGPTGLIRYSRNSRVGRS